jgi:hypothetical protein
VMAMGQDNSPVVTWSLALGGDQADLEAWRIAFKEQPEARITVEQIATGQSQHCLRSSRFDGITDANEVREIGSQMLARMFGAMKLHGEADPVSLGGAAYAHRANGQRDTHVLLPAGILRARAGVIEVFSANQPRPQSEVERIIELAEEDDYVADALEHFSRSHDWFDLYKTLEVLEDDLGRRDVIWQSGWATRAEVTDLVLTANHYRHARAKRPQNMLTIAQARELMRRVLSDWLREKRSVQTL